MKKLENHVIRQCVRIENVKNDVIFMGMNIKKYHGGAMIGSVQNADILLIKKVV